MMNTVRDNLNDLNARDGNSAKVNTPNVFLETAQFTKDPAILVQPPAGTPCRIILADLSQPVDQRYFHILNYSTHIQIWSINDAGTVIQGQVTIDRSGKVIAQDCFTEDWTDYSATSTIVGWSSFTQKVIWYRRIGRLVHVTFDLEGTSNAADVSFTLPFTVVAVPAFSAVHIWNNGVTSATPGCLAFSGSTASIYRDWTGAGGGWTASGTKGTRGQFYFSI